MRELTALYDEYINNDKKGCGSAGNDGPAGRGDSDMTSPAGRAGSDMASPVGRGDSDMASPAGRAGSVKISPAERTGTTLHTANSSDIPAALYGMTEHPGAIPYLSFPLFDETGIVVDAVSTRAGGVSEGYYSSLNFGWSTGDDPARVRENYIRMAEALGVRPDRMVASQQTHTTNIRRVTLADAGKGVVRPRDYKDVDGLVTDIPGLMLVIFSADCVPLLVVDPVRRAIGASHSGWRGTVNLMAEVTVKRMAEEFGSKPEDLRVGIGPCICKDCYEVDWTVAEQFRQRFGEDRSKDIMSEGREGHFQLDLAAANREIFISSGVLPENIAMSGLCTCCEPERFFSHRASNGKRGTIGAFLMIV